MLHKRITLLHLLSLCILFSSIRTAASVPGQGKPVVTILNEKQVEIENKIEELNKYIQEANKLQIPSSPIIESINSTSRFSSIIRITPRHCVAKTTYENFTQQCNLDSLTPKEQLDLLKQLVITNELEVLQDIAIMKNLIDQGTFISKTEVKDFFVEHLNAQKKILEAQLAQLAVPTTPTRQSTSTVNPTEEEEDPIKLQHLWQYGGKWIIGGVSALGLSALLVWYYFYKH